MPTYNAAAVADSVIRHKGGMTLQQGRVLRDNPEAQFSLDGSVPAANRALDVAQFVGGTVGSAALYDVARDGSVTTITTPDFVDGFAYELVAGGLGCNAAAAAFQIELYRETSAAYAAAVAFTAAASSTVNGWSGRVELPLARMVAKGHSILALGGFSSGSGNGSYAGAASIGGVHHTTEQKILRARISISGAGNFTSGRLWLVRRGEWLTR